MAGNLLQEAFGPQQLMGPVLAGLVHTQAFAAVLRRQDGRREEVAQSVVEISAMQVDLQMDREGGENQESREENVALRASGPSV